MRKDPEVVYFQVCSKYGPQGCVGQQWGGVLVFNFTWKDVEKKSQKSSLKPFSQRKTETCVKAQIIQIEV